MPSNRSKAGPHRGGDRTVSAATAAAKRTVDEVRRVLEESDHTQLAARAAEVHERLHASLAAVEAAVAGISEEAVNLAHGFEEELAEAEERIRENPLRAVLIAAGVGLIAGLLLRRR